PGSDRPLKRLKDFQRFAGEVVKIKTAMPLDGQRNFTGRLISASEDTVVIETDNEEIHLPMAAIDRARLVPQY
ncbi:MAG TPA: ribosome maturation factor RimP, partial [Thiotrichales bacterium]|nr:ribosome maturation factor RimP [Thiotrichales bacterium]